MGDDWAVDDRLRRPQTADIGIAGPRGVNIGAGEKALVDQRLLFGHGVDAVHFVLLLGLWRPHTDVSVPQRAVVVVAAGVVVFGADRKNVDRVDPTVGERR